VAGTEDTTIRKQRGIDFNGYNAAILVLQLYFPAHCVVDQDTLEMLDLTGPVSFGNKISDLHLQQFILAVTNQLNSLLVNVGVVALLIDYEYRICHTFKHDPHAGFGLL